MVRYPETHVAATAQSRLETRRDRIPPARGLVLGQNRRGRRFNTRDLQRWIRINRTVFKADKIDVLLLDEKSQAVLPRLLAYAQTLDLRISLRTDCRLAPPDLTALRDAGLLDVFLTPERMGEPNLSVWMETAHAAKLPIRLQLPFPLHSLNEPASLAAQYREAGVVVVNIAARDHFMEAGGCASKQQTHESLQRMAELANAFQELDIECNVLRIPFCLVDRAHWPNVADEAQFFADHQHYRHDSYDLALKLAGRSPVLAGKILTMLLGKYTLFDDPIDNKLLPWLLEAPWLRARIVAWHKLTRHLRLVRSVPTALPEDEARAEKALQRKRRDTIHALGPLCGICSLRHICDRESQDLRDTLPGAEVTPQEGEVVMYPLHFAVDQPKYYDPVDRDRIESDTLARSLAEKAKAVIADRPPDKEIDSFDYETEGQWCHQLPGGVRWFGFSNSEKLSTPLASLDPPFTLSVVFGGGIAEYIGFSLGRDCRLLCPMESYGHELVLHVEKDGRYVLLRDGEPLRPVAFEGHYYAPLRLGDRLEPQISIWNIDNSIVTQNVAVWSEQFRHEPQRTTPKFSVITVCVRYARRLQAVLQAVAHQQNVDPSDIEVIVAYVPGVDSTEDVLDSFALAHPDVQLHRSTFSERKARAKGFIINETLRKARGEWVVLLDADTLIPPNFFQEVLKHTDRTNFIVPDGRLLLDRQTTAQVLLGDIRPWQQWDALLASDGEFRYREMEGVPIGFCQVVRRKCFDQVKYYEADHFEGADWQFSIDMRKQFGQEVRLSGTPVVHLDHGGSKWYGAQRHY